MCNSVELRGDKTYIGRSTKYCYVHTMKQNIRIYVNALMLTACLLWTQPLAAQSASEENHPATLLNVSYDTTRELYDVLNAMFIPYWKDKTRQEVTINQSHGGSSKQARSVIDGLRADVVTLATAHDIDAIAHKAHIIPTDWRSQFAHDSTPYYSTVVFLVRRGNPKKIYDWDDLVRHNVQVITPNPKTSGGGRWNYLAAWAYARWRYEGDVTRQINYMKSLYRHTPILDNGARAATMSFMQREMGDVLVTWENEAMLAQTHAKGQYERIYPSISIRAEPAIAVVEGVSRRKHTQEVARGYLDFLYTPDAQRVIAAQYYRPQDKKIQREFAYQFPPLAEVSVNELGGWERLQKKHFDEGGTFDHINAQ